MIIRLEVLFLFSVVSGWKIFHCQASVWSYQTNKSGSNRDRTFFTLCCSHAELLTAQTNMVCSLFFSMSGCQGKDLALFFDLLLHRPVFPEDNQK